MAGASAVIQPLWCTSNHENHRLIFLALIKIAGEIYSDAVLVSGRVSPGGPDPAAVVVALQPS